MMNSVAQVLLFLTPIVAIVGIIIYKLRRSDNMRRTEEAMLKQYSPEECRRWRETVAETRRKQFSVVPLRIGLSLIGMGIGFILALGISPDDAGVEVLPATFTLFTGIGLFTAFLIEYRYIRKK